MILRSLIDRDLPKVYKSYIQEENRLLKKIGRK